MLHYSIYRTNKNNADWITFIHGAGGSSSIWFPQIRAFSEQHNVLLIDLRGHGKSKHQNFLTRYSFELIVDEVKEVIDHLKIEASHFIGISLGTLIIRSFYTQYPERVSSLVMSGAVMELNFKSRFLMRLGNIFKSVLPYLILYKFFALIIMPKKSHKKSRNIFIKEAKKLYQKEFKRWFSLAAEIKPLMKLFKTTEPTVPTIYVMGEDDHMFLPSIKKLVSHHKTAQLSVIKNSGHVVNIDQPKIFNNIVLSFVAEIKNCPSF